MLSYTEHRARRIEAAGSYSGWDRPPFPFQSTGRNIGRVVMVSFGFEDTIVVRGYYQPSPAMYALDALFKRKEKMQNRRHFS